RSDHIGGLRRPNLGDRHWHLLPSARHQRASAILSPDAGCLAESEAPSELSWPAAPTIATALGDRWIDRPGTNAQIARLTIGPVLARRRARMVDQTAARDFAGLDRPPRSSPHALAGPAARRGAAFARCASV